MKTLISFVLGILLSAVPALAQDQRTTTPPLERKEARALRIEQGRIHVDGHADEPDWERAPAIQDFVQKEPTENAGPAERMDVRFLYDDNALYISARMYKNAGSAIQAPMGRRDRLEQSENILIALDTFLDRRTAYVFGVTASGVRIDRFHPKDDESTFDETYDPVWEAKTSVDERGWSAELWIPFSQLRFNNQPELVWGLNIHRYTPTLDEDDYWVPIPRTAIAWSSRFGNLAGISNLPATRRLEVVPYVAGASTIVGSRNHSNPFNAGANPEGRSGADLKVGIGSNLTLDATFNPDFGQVEADPAEVNLSAFETIFTEKRPFFVEDANLMNLATKPNFYYSRRIGGRPTAPANGDFVDYPASTTILGAAKLTGRMPSGTSVGMLGGVTDEEAANVQNLGSPGIDKIRVAPRTEWALARIQQEFGKSKSTFSGMMTYVHRNHSANDPLAQLLVGRALAFASDATLRFKGGQYEYTPFFGITFLHGEPGAISRVQRNSAHYAQRPDRDYQKFDPTLTSLTGPWFGSTFARTGGRHWVWNIFQEVQSPSVETNDFGRLNSADSNVVNGNLRWRETVPGKRLRAYWYGIRQNNEWTWGEIRQGKSVAGYMSQTWRNFWISNATYTVNFVRQDTRLTRGGPSMELPHGWTLQMALRNRASAQTAWSGDFTTTGSEDGGSNKRFVGHIALRPGPRWQFSIDPILQHQVDAQQYIATFSGGRPEVYGQRYVFGAIERNTYSMQFRLGFTLKPDVNLDVYAEPFAASGRYSHIGELLLPGTRLRREYGTDGTTLAKLTDGTLVVTDGDATFKIPDNDFNTHSFRSNVVLKWEYRPGSLFYLVWQQDRRKTETLSDKIGFDDPFRSLTIPGNNYFVVKTTFWLSVK